MNDVNPSSVSMRCSKTDMSTIFPASTNFLVIEISSLDGSNCQMDDCELL